jgi:hypothetical protein
MIGESRVENHESTQKQRQNSPESVIRAKAGSEAML